MDSPLENSPALSETRIRELAELEERIGYRFGDRGLLDLALTHRSYLSGSSRLEAPRLSYELLEFLGDSILEFLISESLLFRLPNRSEGELSKIRSFLVSSQQLARLSRDLGLGEYIRLSHGEEKSGGREKRALLADLFESVIAALYLDGGLEAARSFVQGQFGTLIGQAEASYRDYRDDKSALQERLHALGLPNPDYRVLEELGPDHRKHFVVRVSSGERVLGTGSGTSKKEAEQDAAARANRALTGDSEQG